MATKAKSPKTETIELTFQKSTPGTHVYGLPERDKAALCSQVYLSRAVLGDTPPKTIKLSVEF